jgi:hypothetical protein
MYSIIISGKEYQVKFGFNSFCDTDLMDRTKDLIMLFQNENVSDDQGAAMLGKIKDLFICVRDLLFVGFQKFNPVKSPQEIGDLLDQYHDEGDEENPHGIMDLFGDLGNELMSEGFLGDLMKQGAEEAQAPRPRSITKKK